MIMRQYGQHRLKIITVNRVVQFWFCKRVNVFFCFHSSIAIDTFPWIQQNLRTFFMYSRKCKYDVDLVFLILAHAPHQTIKHRNSCRAFLRLCVAYTPMGLDVSPKFKHRLALYWYIAVMVGECYCFGCFQWFFFLGSAFANKIRLACINMCAV